MRTIITGIGSSICFPRPGLAEALPTAQKPGTTGADAHSDSPHVLPDASWIVREEGMSGHHADYATCGLREGLLEQVAHLFPRAGVCLGVVAGEVGASQPIRLFIGEAVHDPAIDGDLPIHAARAQHFAEGFA
jgi:hypothetical protein